MSGGAWEYVAAYVNNGHSCLKDAGYVKALTEGAAKYKNEYYSTTTSGANTQSADYAYANPNYEGTYPSGYSKKYGDAVWETSNSYTGVNSWYSEYSDFPYGSSPVFGRGGDYTNTSRAGVFYFYEGSGGEHIFRSFRVVVPVF